MGMAIQLSSNQISIYLYINTVSSNAIHLYMLFLHATILHFSSWLFILSSKLHSFLQLYAPKTFFKSFYNQLLLYYLMFKPSGKVPLLKTILLFTLAVSTFSFYNTITSKQMVYLSAIAYDPPANIANWTGQYCDAINIQRQVVFNASDSRLGYIGVREQEGSIIIVFRGTDDIQNWLTDGDAIKVGYSYCQGCEIHRGFYDSYNALAPQVQSLYQQYRNAYPRYSLKITGHSLGGALAVLCALNLRATFGVISEVYTYGEPRIGNKNFAAFADYTLPYIYRVINYADVIPHLPSFSMGFYHEGLQEWYSPAGMQQYYQCAAQSPNCSDSIPDVDLSAADHHIAEYMKLKAAVTPYDYMYMEKSETRSRSGQLREQISH